MTFTILVYGTSQTKITFHIKRPVYSTIYFKFLEDFINEFRYTAHFDAIWSEHERLKYHAYELKFINT